ncbi:HvfC/BufC N-terminal domain-containing protein [Methylotetracoccus oryzae]|uniref:HvfC/BufC N-terminal domain-containing protein n=1 Tax=Methylotetracoccus oryzae TaxID=1919059 RepID=UPI001119BE7A|nr:DNA-binding domain-containing protein [Methylotetracoccus oryzae]
MPSLADTQRGFSAAVFASDPGSIRPWIRANGLSPERRLGLYRNNTFLGLSEALRDGFPVVHRLVGTEFFDALARSFVAEHPPRSGCLLDYGAEFPASIAGSELAASLPYLPDVARLEWAWHEAFHAAEAPAFGVAELAAVPPERHTQLSLRLRPSVRLLASPWPVLRIFHVNQPEYSGDPSIDLDRETGCRVLVLREGAEVLLHPLSAGEFACLERLSREGSLETAFEAAIRAEPGFDLPASLVRLMGLHVFNHPARFAGGALP